MKSITRILLATLLVPLMSATWVHATISPDAVSGLALWLDAGFGVTTNGGGMVTQWNDRVDGVNNTVAHNVTTNNPSGGNPGPSFIASGIGGLPSLSFSPAPN